MITDVLMERAWLAPTAFVLLVLLAPVAGWWLIDRPRVARGAFVCSLVPVAITTLVPVSRRAFQFCAVQWTAPTPSRVELVANVVLFIAPAAILTVLTRRPVMAVLALVALSGVIELTQAVVPAIGRSCDTNDWANNTLGAAIGAGLGALALWHGAIGDRRSSARRAKRAEAPAADASS